MKNLYKVLFVLFIFSLFSCEIGLGAAVDTEPPTLNIVSPVSDAVIRDAFRLSGTWSDDGSIAGLQVYLDAPDGTASYGPFEGVFVESEEENVENTWYCVIDPKASGVPDGSYEAKISMTDEGEHTTTQSRQIVVDNTAPIIVLQRPSSKAVDSSPDSYGQTFTLEGQAADDNNVSLIRVNIFSDEACTQRVHYVDLTNVPPTISLDVAKFGEDNYTKIYGSSGKEGAKEFYCTIEGYDGAVRYPADGSAQTPEDLLGNPVHSYYLYEEIGTSILSQHKITEVYHMLNGSYLRTDVSRSADTVNSVASILNSHVVTCGRFSLNPENNPTFTVSGRSVLKKDGNDFANPDYAITNGSAAIIEVAPGLDGISIQDDDRFRVYVLPCDANGNPVSSEKIYPTSTKTKSGSNFKFVTTISTTDGLSIGKDYIFGFDGTDQKGNDIRPNCGVFGFHMASSGAAPTLNVTNPTDSMIYKKAGDNVIVKGSTEVEEGTPTVQVLTGGVVVASKAFDVSEATVIGDNKHYDFEFTIPASVFAQDTTAQYNLVIQSVSDALKTTVNKTVFYDVKLPEVKSLSISPITEKFKEHNNVVNKKFTFSGVVTDDDFVDSVWYEFKQGGNVKKSGGISSVFNNIEIDTDDGTIADKADAELIIYAKDRAGQINEKPYNCYVDQDSDKPTVTSKAPTRLDLSYADITTLESGDKNRFSKSGESLQINIEDDDGIANALVKILKEDGTEYNLIDYNACTLPTVVGKYKIQILVTDVAGTCENYKAAEFWIMVTGSNPEVTASLSPEFVNTKTADSGKLTVNIEVVNEGVTSYEIYVDDSGTPFATIPAKNPGDTTPYTYTGTITLPQNTLSGEKTFKVKDTTKQLFTEKTVKFKVDNESPSINLLAPSPSVEIKGNNALSGTEFVFTGNANDTGSGVTKLYYAFTTTNTAPTDDSTNWFAQDAFNGRWNINATITSGSGTPSETNSVVSLYEGHYWLHVKAVDLAGNTTSISPKEIYIDNAKPDVTISAPQYVNKSTDFGNRTVSLTGTITESNELTELKIYRSGTAAEIKSFTIGSGNEIVSAPNGASWTFTDTAPADGSYTYTIIAKDAAEKTTTKTVDVVVDTVAPTADISKVTTPSINQTENTLFKFVGENGSVIDSGTSSGIEDVEIAFTTTNSAPAIKDFSVTTDSNGAWNSTVIFTDYSAFSSEETKYVWLKVTDKAGNTSGWVNTYLDSGTSKEKSFVYDKESPVIILTTAPADHSYLKNSSITIEGTADDSYGIEKIELYNSSNLIKEVTYKSQDKKSWNITESLTDGNYTLNCVVTDKSGKTSKESRTITIDTIPPVIGTPVITNGTKDIHNVNGTTWYSTKTIKLKVIPTDTNGSGVTSVAYSTVASATRTADDWIELTNDGSGNFTGNIVFANDGTNTIYLKATDKAGNVAGEDDSSSMQFNIDSTKPNLAITSTIPTYMGSSGFGIDITASDPAPSSGNVVLTIKEEHKAAEEDDSKYVVTEKSGKKVTITSGSETIAVPLSGTTPVEGNYRYTFTLTDPAENSVTSESYVTTVDTTAPVVTIISPTADSVISETYPQVTGKYTEAVALKNVYYKFATSAPAVGSASDLVGWDKATKTSTHGTDQDWNFYQSFKVKGVAGTGLEEGAYTLYIYAEDEAGNYNTTAVTRNYKVDMAAPDVTISAPQYVNKSTDSGNRTVSLAGTITESNELTELKIYRSGTADSIKSFTIGSGNEIASAPNGASWTFTDTAPADGSYTYTITAKDMAGKTTTKTVNVVVDTVAPTVNAAKILTPDSKQTENKLYKFTATSDCATDGTSGSGYSKVEFAFTTSETAPAAAMDFVDLASNNAAWNSTVEFDNAKYNSVFSTEGTKYLYMRVFDVAGNVSDWSHTSFVYDTATPEIRFTASPDENAYIKTDIKLEVEAKDSYGVKSVIAVGKVAFTAEPKNWASLYNKYYTDEVCTIASTVTFTAGTYYYPFPLSAKSGVVDTYVKDIPVTDIADGKYDFTVKVTDNSDKQNEIKRLFTVDTTAPEIAATLTWSDSPADGVPHSNKAPKLKVDVTDDNPQYKYYYINDGTVSDETSLSDNDWNEISGEKTISIPDGEGYIWIKAVDKAGNTSYKKDIPYNVDTTEPEEVTLVKVDNETLSGNKLINGNSAVEFTVSAKDKEDEDRVGSVNLSVVGTAFTVADSDKNDSTKNGKGSYDSTNKIWKITIPASAFAGKESGTLDVKVVATDKAGNSTRDTRLFTLELDKTSPTVSVRENCLNDEDEETGISVNKFIQLSGTAEDDNMKEITGIDFRTYDSENSEWNEWTTLIVKGKLNGEASDTQYLYDEKSSTTPSTKLFTKDKPTTSWTTNYIDTTALFPASSSEKVQVQFRINAKDKAENTGFVIYGNEAPDQEDSIFVDQDSDRPIISTTNLTFAAAGSTSYLRNTKTLNGTITDYDGVQSMSYKLKASDSYTPLTLTGGSSWSITLSEEGANTIFFKVTDKAGTDFESNGTIKPKLSDGTNTVTTGDGILAFNVVTKNPQIKDYKYSVYDGKEWSAWSSSLRTLGGNYTMFKVQFSAQSANIIDENEVKAKFNNGTDVAFTPTGIVEDAEYHTWTSGELNIASDVTGKKDLAITVKDLAGMSVEPSVDVIVDNVAPELTISKPSTLITSEETIHGTVNESSTLYWAVSKYDATADNVKPNSDTANRLDNTTVLATKWTQIESETALNWYVYFDEGRTLDHTKKFAEYLTEDYLGVTTKAAIADSEHPFDTVTPVYFWIKAVDECGNVTEMSQKLMVDPQGERPSVEISYPINVNGNVPTLGGTIMMTGTASDNNAPKYVWIQIDADGTEGFGKADLQKLKDSNYKIGKISTNKDVADITSVTDETASQYAVMVEVKGAGWTQAINTNKEFNPTGEGKSTLNITVYATDQDDDETIHISLPATQTVEIDAKNPYVEMSSLKLVQYAKLDGSACTDGSVTSGTIVNTQNYTEGMSIRGIWYLTGKFKDDDSGIKKITYNGADKVTTAGSNFTGTGDDAGVVFTPESDDYNSNTIYHYNFQIPLGSTEIGKVGTSTASFNVIEATTTELHIEPSFSVIFDNKAPDLTTTGDSPFRKMAELVQNSNGFYTFGTIASEEAVTVNGTNIPQSGVERVAFYFTRDLAYNIYDKDSATYSEHSSTNTVTHDLFDVMISNTGNETDDIASGNLIVDYKDAYGTAKSGLKLEDGIYWREISGTVSGSSFTYTGTADKNIHPKGIVKIKGTVYLINSISETTVTLSGAPGDGSVTAYFGLCNVIDNSGEKNSGVISTTRGYGYGYYPSRTTDDGDLFTETFTNQGTDWIFDASINSKNLPDGPITVHMIAFDKAGNSKGYTYSGTVSNNAPRIAGIIVGTDEDGNGEVDENEFITSYSNKYNLGYNSSGDEVRDATFPIQVGTTPTSILTIKGKTVVKPELVGGNGKLSYKYKVFKHSSALTWEATAERTVDAPVEIGTGTTDAVATLEKNIELPIEHFIGTNDGEDSESISDGNNKKFEFSFGDSTPGTTLEGGISNNAKISVIMNVALRETNKAKNWILPFYWNKADDNSLFNNSKEKGHIELTKDLPSATFNSTGIYDKQPKVSGMIKLEGIAQDDTLLNDITVTFNKKYGAIDANTPITIASYGNGTWTDNALSSGEIPSDSKWASEITNATYGELKAAGIITAIPEGKKAADEVPENSQEYGHVVHWTMYLDTAQFAGVAVADVGITAKANDRGTPKWSASANSNAGGAVYSPNAAEVTNSTVTLSGGNDGVSALGGNYGMDVVPYITGLGTRLDDAYAGNTSVFNRSANGNYPVKRSEAGVKLYGFNLNGASTTVKFNGTSVGTVTAKPNTDTTETRNYVSFTVPAAATSGEIEITVNSIASLNNKNDDSKEYNKEGNGINNNTLTDTRKVSVWGIKQIISNNNIRYPKFRIGKDTNQSYAFVYDNGGRWVNYVLNNTTEVQMDMSYSQWFDTAVAVDTAGNVYASAQNGDSTSTTYANYKFYAFANSMRGNYYNSTIGAYYDDKTSVMLECCYDGSKFKAERIINPKIVTMGSDTTKMYTVYYDTSTGTNKFRYGEATKKSKQIAFNSSYGIQSRGSNRSADNSQPIATGDSAGEYSAVGVIPTGVTGAGTAVVCWYDTGAHALKFKYNTDPTGTIWSTAITIDSDYAGEYCDLAVDAAGGIHMAYFRAGGKLKYAYLSSYNATKADVCTVDSYLSVGTNISIETSSKTITENGTTRYVPYISYFTDALKLAKVAWPVTLGTNTTSNGTNTFTDGAVNDMFTGSWEVQVLPTNLATTLLNYTIGVGEKKKDTTNQSVMLGYGTKAGLETALLY